jgi:hypothetical protein
MRSIAALFLSLVSAFAQSRAGAAKRIITPDLSKGPVYLAGFDHNRVATKVHDDLYARCIALAADRILVVCGVDSIGLFIEDVQKIRDSAAEKMEQPVDIIVAALHDHEAPDTMGLWGPAPDKTGIDEEYNLFVIDRTAEAAAEAVKSLKPATWKTASVKTSELDGFINDDRPPRVTDAELVVLSAVDRRGRTIATLVNWANHPETLGSRNTEVTADYPGYFYSQLEKRIGGIAVLVNGAIGGMQSPLGAEIRDPATHKPAPEESFRKAEILGRRVADLAADACRTAKPQAFEHIEYREAELELPVDNRLFRAAAAAGLFEHRKPVTAEGDMRTRIAVFRIASGSGPLVEAAVVPGELYPELSVGGVVRYHGADFPEAPFEPPLKKLMTAPFRMLIGLGNDEIGYIIPKAEWDEKPPYLQDAPKAWYGEVNSLGPETAPLILAAFQSLFHAEPPQQPGKKPER